MDKLKKLLCCLWSTPTVILIATILYLYADRNEYIHLKGIKSERGKYDGEVIQVTNKWTGETCLALTDLYTQDYVTGLHTAYPLCDSTGFYKSKGFVQ